MFDRWETKQALIVVKTYPTPAWKGGEVVCTAALTEDGEWLRLFPIPRRSLDDTKQFEKYQWIEARLTRGSDARPESYKVDIESIKLLKPPLTSRNNWEARKAVVLPRLAQSMCWLREENKAHNRPTLGVIHPREITRLRIVPVNADWSSEELARLNQLSLIDSSRVQLEKVPFNFVYQFKCEDAKCRGHNMSCTDWEMAQAYRSWRKKYGDNWEPAFRQKFETEMKERFDTYFYVGTVHGNPWNWVIVGLFYPLKESPSEGIQRGLFDASTEL